MEFSFLIDDDTNDNNTTSMFLMFLLLLLDEENKDILNDIDSRNFQSLLYRRALSGTIHRGSLQNPTKSVFWEVYNSGQDESLIQLCGFHKAGFDSLLELFAPTYDTFTPHGKTIRAVKKKGGRNRLLSPAACLGLVLTWLRSRGGNKFLCFMFGIIPSSCSIWLRYGKRVLIKVLRNVDAAKVKMPSDDDVTTYVNMIQDKYPALTNCWGAMDGLKIGLEAAGDKQTQSRFYNGWKCDHYISNLFLFSPAGRICAAYFNAPGTVHDSTMALMSGIYSKIDEVYVRTGARVVVDSAFSKNSRNSLIKSFASNIDRDGRNRQPNSVNRDATSVRQLSEWGMRGLQGSFPRLKDRIPWEEHGERKLLMQLVIYLYNFRTETVGLNQTASVYQKSLDSTANEMITNNN